MKKSTTADCLYVSGDSWAYGSELIDPSNNFIKDHFHPAHEAYRKTKHWPRLVADQLRLELVDGTYPGASNDRMLRTCMHDVSRLILQGRRPFVVIAWTQLQRFELPEGPRGDLYRGFIGPRDGGLPSVARDIFKMWSSDRTDVIRWIQQLLSLDYFFKTNGLDYLSTTVFKETYWLYEQTVSKEQDYFKPYLDQIKKHLDLNRHLLHISMETYLRQQADVTYGPGGHPLEQGHRLLSEQLLAQLNTKFQFQRLHDQSSAT